MDEDVIREQLAVVTQEHRDLDAAILALQQTGTYDVLQVQRLKKRKLSLKDQIERLQNLLIPDIIA